MLISLQYTYGLLQPHFFTFEKAKRAGHAGYNGAKVVSIGVRSMVLEFNGAHATEYSEERVEQEKVGSNPSLAIGETLQSATIPEMTVNNLEYFAGGF